jgi:hypothetical protein
MEEEEEEEEWGTTTTVRTLSSFAGVSTGTLAPSLVTVQPVRSPSAKVAGHTLRRPRAPPNVRDALLFPATIPSLV